MDFQFGAHAKAKSRFEKALVSLQIFHNAILQPSASEIETLGEFEKSLINSGWNKPENIQKSADALSETFAFLGTADGEIEADMEAWDKGDLVWPKPISSQKLQEIRNSRLTEMRSYYKGQMEGIKNLTSEERQSLKLNVSAGIYLYSYMSEADQKNSFMDEVFQKENASWLVRTREEIIKEQIRNGEAL
ncbi:hypothetical protein EHQ52_19565 [Leptospira koniambonensis]|uniref:Uncharacterized protein n=1 Tax=Leptospira koniambonensis TaxID=2484950 RepID=A0A4R9J2S2_9LEPT|nr:hypothetical protein [Leptospira koniambonensis]TGL28463.1 hypothetical protein EHQ52_19565 [Leptospira koniambonensis]